MQLFRGVKIPSTGASIIHRAVRALWRSENKKCGQPFYVFNFSRVHIRSPSCNEKCKYRLRFYRSFVSIKKAQKKPAVVFRCIRASNLNNVVVLSGWRCIFEWLMCLNKICGMKLFGNAVQNILHFCTSQRNLKAFY